MSLLEKIKNLNILTIRGEINPQYNKILFKNPEVLQELETKYHHISNATPRELLYLVINNQANRPLCKQCQLNQVKFIKDGKRRNSYYEFCSLKCSNMNVNVKDKKSKTAQLHYGTENPSQSDIIKQKKIQTSRNKFGVDYPWQLQTIQDKKRHTLQTMHGVDHLSKTKEFQDKRRRTCIEKYGGPSPICDETIKQKQQATNVARYNAKNFNQKHIPAIVLERLQDKQWLFHKHHNEKCTLEEIATFLGINDVTVGNYFKQHQIPVQIFQASTAEKQLVEFLNSINVTTISNDRTIISPQELDIVIPTHKVAIEFCGLYWHSNIHKPINYHRDKFVKAKEKGYRLITVFEDEWVHNQPIVENKLKSILGVDDRETVYARECSIEVITTQNKTSFFETNHIQGNGPSSINIGLQYKNEIVSVMGLVRQSYNTYILNRYATSKRVVGGFSKLLNAFATTHDWNQIVTFADQRWSNGDMYLRCGFKQDKIILPDYSYVIADNRVHKFNYRHKNLKKKIKDYDPSLSERQNTERANIIKIYDCGKIRFVKYR